MEKYISLEAAVAAMTALRQEDIEAFGMVIPECFPSASAIGALNRIPAADVVSAEDYKHLLRIANKMHLWIFNHTFDEQAAYDECGLTDEDNAMLGYGGSWELRADSAE